METSTNPEFSLCIDDCPQGGPLKRSIECEVVIVPLNNQFPHGQDISIFFIQKVINCILSLLYPKIHGGVIGTEIKLDVSFLNHPTEVPVSDSRLVGIDRILNPVRGRSSLHGILKINNCIFNDDGKFITLDLEIQFFIQGTKVGNARYQIRRSSQYSLRA